MGKYYAVQNGRETGVFSNWSSAQSSVNGYSGAVYKSFNTASEARAFASSGGGYQGGNAAAASVSSSSGGGSSYSSSGYSGSSYTGGYSGSSYSGGYSRSSGGGGGYYSGSSSASKSSSRSSSHATTTVYTDGSSRGNGQAGASAGYGVFYGDNDSRNYSGKLSGDRQTNQRAELQGIVRALENEYKSPSPGGLRIMTDSAYSKKALTEWGDTWEKRDYKTATGKDVENQDLIRQGRDYITKIQEKYESTNPGASVSIEKVSGHSGNYGNEMADKLANKGATS